MAPRDVVGRGARRDWREALGVDEIGIDDDFFDLGRRSDRRGQAVNAIARVFRKNISLAAISGTRGQTIRRA